jgi:hypothetical protein
MCERLGRSCGTNCSISLWRAQIEKFWALPTEKARRQFLERFRKWRKSLAKQAVREAPEVRRPKLAAAHAKRERKRLRRLREMQGGVEMECEPEEIIPTEEVT